VLRERRPEVAKILSTVCRAAHRALCACFPLAQASGMRLTFGMVSMQDIERYCAAIAAAFQPRRIILFGSHAYGAPTEDSDVDVLVVMPRKRYRRDLDLRIRRKVPARFAVDVLVEAEDRLDRRIEDRECFILDVTEKGRTMYEAGHA
jgi:predicted nucleotidyltransferase